MIEDMSTVRMNENEVTANFAGVLEKIRNGVEIIVEQDHRPVAVIRAPLPEGRLLSECIRLAEARGTTAIPDEGFMKDVEEGIAERSKPWNPPSWE
jgi:antitoxin (DNA-binding transcriptional repressor) of toxin-antitoxin stability system